MRVPFLNLRREYNLISKKVNSKILQVLASGEYSYGRETELFEKRFTQLTGSKYCLATASGTVSLVIALKALGVQPGDEVITTPLTFIATVEAIVHVGAKPVFIDIEEETLNLNPSLLEKAITKKTKAIIPVHLYGICPNMDLLLQTARKQGLSVIEDAAHALGGKYKNHPLGSLGEIGCFSLYPTKSLGAYGNAGAVVTDKKILINKMRQLADHGRGRERNTCYEIGYTGKINNLQAAILNVKFTYFKKRMRRKMIISKKYTKAFKSLPIINPPLIPKYCSPVFYVYTIRSQKRDSLRKFLFNQGIETRIYYSLPLHLQPSLKSFGYKKGDLPIAERVVKSILSLPLYPEMTDEEVKYISCKIKEFTKQ